MTDFYIRATLAINELNPFLDNVPISYSLKIPGYKMGTLV